MLYETPFTSTNLVTDEKDLSTHWCCIIQDHDRRACLPV